MQHPGLAVSQEAPKPPEQSLKRCGYYTREQLRLHAASIDRGNSLARSQDPRLPKSTQRKVRLASTADCADCLKWTSTLPCKLLWLYRWHSGNYPTSRQHSCKEWEHGLAAPGVLLAKFLTVARVLLERPDIHLRGRNSKEDRGYRPEGVRQRTSTSERDLGELMHLRSRM